MEASEDVTVDADLSTGVLMNGISMLEVRPAPLTSWPPERLPWLLLPRLALLRLTSLLLWLWLLLMTLLNLLLL